MSEIGKFVAVLADEKAAGNLGRLPVPYLVVTNTGEVRGVHIRS